MPPGTEEVIHSAEQTGHWEAVALACILVAFLGFGSGLFGLIGWAFRRCFQDGGYFDRWVSRTTQFIDSMDKREAARDQSCAVHANAITQIAESLNRHENGCSEMCRAIQEQTRILTDSDGINAPVSRLEASATELADVALLLFDRPIEQLTEEERETTKAKIIKVRERHAKK